ncbi:MAG: DUF309 domain-containing protein [Bradymonadaceae bacterium]
MTDDWHRGLDQLAAADFWQAHESWEAIWRDLPDDSAAREATQALIQFAAACYKVQQARQGRAPANMQQGMAALVDLARGHLDNAADGAPPTTSWPHALLREALDRLDELLARWRDTDDLEATDAVVHRLADQLASRLLDYDRAVAN